MTTKLNKGFPVGPFDEDEIGTVVIEVAEGCDLVWETLGEDEQEALLAQAVGALANIPEDKLPTTHSVAASEFRKLVVREFEFDERWSREAHAAGLTYEGPLRG